MQPEPLVYVIDDDDAVKQSLEFLLKTAKIKVQGFDSAKAFLEILPQVKSGCIVTDIRMPEITGIDLLRRVAPTLLFTHPRHDYMMDHEVASRLALTTEVEGSAHLTGEHEFVLDERDGLGTGFLLR